MTDSRTTLERKEEKVSHKLKQENLALRKVIKDITEKHNNLLDALSKTGLNIQIICTQNKFLRSKT